MSATVLSRTAKGISVWVDDETPISDEPITLSVESRLAQYHGDGLHEALQALTPDEAYELGKALFRAAAGARQRKYMEEQCRT